MGLDVYLYTREQHEANDRHNAASDAFYGRPDYDQLTDEQKDEIRATIPPYAHQTDVPSERHPDHLFNRRYLRSSYNGGGFNRAVPDFVGDKDATLDDIFAPVWAADFEPLVTAEVIVPGAEEASTELAVRESEAGEESEGDRTGEPGGIIDARHLPALAEAKGRALDIAERLRGCDRLRVLTVSPNQFSGLDFLQVDDEAALRIYREHMAERSDRSPFNDDEGWYSSRDLDYVFGKSGTTFLAAISGAEKQFFADRPWPAMHLIYRAEGDGFDSYVQSAEITAEFCDEAVSLIERDGWAYISWSG